MFPIINRKENATASGETLTGMGRRLKFMSCGGFSGLRGERALRLAEKKD